MAPVARTDDWHMAPLKSLLWTMLYLMSDIVAPESMRHCTGCEFTSMVA